MIYQSSDDRIHQLEHELYCVRHAIIHLMPDEFVDLLDRCPRFQTRDEFDQWTTRVVEAIVASAAESVDSPRSYRNPPRAYCPLCHQGTESEEQQGFMIPLGLQRHLIGYARCQQCPVTNAAFSLAWQVSRDTIRLKAEEKQAAAEDLLRRRRTTEMLFKVGPNEEPVLIDEGWGAGSPRTAKQLIWAEERLRGLGFAVVSEQRVKSYVKGDDNSVVYADPRSSGKITFSVYSKPLKKRSQREQGEFYLLDSWTNDLLGKFDERCAKVSR
jgi:hypothetical protein